MHHKYVFAASRAATAALALGGLLLPGARAAAQQGAKPCTILCAPTVVFGIGEDRTHVFGGPTVRNDSTGAVSKVPSQSVMVLQFIAVAKTAVPHLQAYVNATWLPTARSRANPFTEYTASQVGEDKIRANEVTLSMGGLVELLPKAAAQGYFGIDGYLADLRSPAARPGDASAYTHKLDLGAIALLYPFAGLDSTSALRRSGLFASLTLDYVATGLPKAGDTVPKGRTFLTAAKPAALLATVAIPIAPFLQSK